MVVENFDAVRALFRPTEAKAVLLIDANAILALSIAAEGFKTIAWWAIEVGEIGGCMQN